MFPKKNRILKREFDELMKNSRVFHSESISLRLMKKAKETLPKFAFVVSKKVAKNATDRNKMKRKGFHALREIIFPDTIIKMKGCMGAFFFKKEGKETKFDELKNEIEGLLKKSGIL
ncbi:MAG: ribonuclease P protein component [Candidatus Staskawiczbacteria bacterium]